MLNTNNLIKLGASVCAALLILLFANWAASSMYKVADDAHHGDHAGDHGEEDHGPTRGFVIAAVGEADEGAEEEVVEVSFAEIYAAADPADGEKAFRKCQACHKLGDGENGTGPHLYALLDRPIGGVDGFAYSDDLANHGGTWTVDELNVWLEDPKAWAPGSKMVLKTNKVEDRAALIAYLATIGG